MTMTAIPWMSNDVAQLHGFTIHGSGVLTFVNDA